MKKLLIVACGLSCLVWGCKKSKNTTPDPVMQLGMSATINGVPWVADTNLISPISIFNYFDISGYDATGRTIELRINNFKNRGTFNIPTPNDSALYDTDFNIMAHAVMATAGSLTIKAVNDTAVGGTFSFSGNGVTVTNGTFYWRYQ